MNFPTPAFWPVGAVASHRVSCVMDVILHVGAHRTGTKTFQDYLRRHAEPLAKANVSYWGPGRTRRGLFTGLGQNVDATTADEHVCRAEDRIRLQLAAARDRGLKTLLISDENMIGTIPDNIRTSSLYPTIGARMARYVRAFEAQLSTVIISPRSLEYYWSSALAYAVARGHAVPERDRLRAIAQSTRGWRDVIADLARALPTTQIRVLPFEHVSGRPEVLLEKGACVNAPLDTDRVWLNRTPTLPELRRVLAERGVAGSTLPFGMERWNPFTPEETAALRETYADDMMWLVAGADGMATLTEDQARTRAGKILPAGAQTKGHGDEQEERQLARPG